ncbi:MAG: DUF4294 domain-containing protein [Bacteroidales bacterium]|nr:DUF4294 domain-containing protein [Bacteroidales bacterium]MDD7528361.1 DUF4294 domain-containing protein [Bacteroidales bacterium]
MQKRFWGILFCIVMCCNTAVMAATPESNGTLVRAVVSHGDTVFVLPTVYAFPPMKFKNKREEKFYWRTVRDVKKVLPYSKLISTLVQEVNDTLMRIPTKKERDRYMRQWEKTTYRKYYKEFTHMTLNQGKLLIRLVDRECQTSSYELIRAYRGSFSAGFYQMFAKLFGADLKSKFGTGRNDKIIERIIILVEAGQL